MASIPNAIYLLELLIRKLKIPVTTFTIEKELLEHPDYPSLLSLSDCLTNWNTPNEAFKIDKEQGEVEELPCPFLAHIKIEGGRFILITEIWDNTVKFSDEREKHGSMAQGEFIKNWDGVVLYAEKNEFSGEQKYNQSLLRSWLNKARLPVMILTLLITSIYAIDANNISISYVSLLVIKLLGIIISGLLLATSIDANNPFIQNLCSLGKKNNCNAILRSQAANVTSWLTWSEVGMFYFAGSFISLLLNYKSIELLSLINILALPYTIYSIGYQIKIKNWCVLCCTVQLLLWLETIAFYLGGFSFKTHSFYDVPVISGLILSFLSPIVFWSLLKPVLSKANQIKPLKQQLKIFKYNRSLFMQLLGSQTCYEIPDDLMPISLGNPRAETVITMVSNPFCEPCATIHKELSEWLSKREDLQFKVIFATSNEDNDQRTKVARHITALSLNGDKKWVEEAINNWYNQSDKNYEDWSKKYPANGIEDYHVATEKQKEWCQMAEIEFTPTILINGYKLIDPYRVQDMKFLL